MRQREDEVHGAGFAGLAQFVAARAEDLQHLVISVDDERFKLLESVVPRFLGEVFQEQGAEPFAVQFVVDKERHFRGILAHA